jgi:hypothetical protein
MLTFRCVLFVRAEADSRIPSTEVALTIDSIKIQRKDDGGQMFIPYS